MSSLHSWGRAGTGLNPSPGEAGGRVKGAKRWLVLTSSSNTMMSADSRGKQLVNLAEILSRKKSEPSETTVIINAK